MLFDRTHIMVVYELHRLVADIVVIEVNLNETVVSDFYHMGVFHTYSFHS